MEINKSKVIEGVLLGVCDDATHIYFNHPEKREARASFSQNVVRFVQLIRDLPDAEQQVWMRRLSTSVFGPVGRPFWIDSDNPVSKVV